MKQTKPDANGTAVKISEPGKTSETTTVRRAVIFASAAALTAGLMLGTAKSAQAEEARTAGATRDRITDVTSGTTVQAFVGLYDHGETPVLGIGLAEHLEFPRAHGVSLDLSAVISTDTHSIHLESAELDVTVPLWRRISLTAYWYRDRFLNVVNGIGGMFNWVNFHLASEWIDGWWDVFARYRIATSDGRFSVTPQAIVMGSGSTLTGYGVGLRAEIAVSEHVSLTGRASYTLTPNGEPMNTNMQLGATIRLP